MCHPQECGGGEERLLAYTVAFYVLLAAANAPIPIATTGCLNEQLSNGVWSVRVLSVQRGVTYDDGVETTGVAVNLQVRNVTSATLQPDETGFSDISGTGITLRYADGKRVGVTIAGSPAEVLFDRRIKPAEQATLAFYFPYAPQSKESQPALLTIPVHPNSRSNTARARYEAPDATFRIDLTCKK